MGAAKRFCGDRKSAPACLLPIDRITQPAAPQPPILPPGCTPSECPGWVRLPDGKSYSALAPAVAAPPTPHAVPPRGETRQLSLFD